MIKHIDPTQGNGMLYEYELGYEVVAGFLSTTLNNFHQPCIKKKYMVTLKMI